MSSYRCEHCSATNVVAAPVLYRDGTREYSGTFYSGVTQTYSARAVAPPVRRGYLRPFAIWGALILLWSWWTLIGFASIFRYHKTSIFRFDLAGAFVLADLVCLAGLFINLRKVARFNRLVFPQLHWNWEHTFICRHCGRSWVIAS